MVKIRLACGGVKKRPCYRIVVSDNRSPRDGRFIERIGFFNPFVSNNKQQSVELNLNRVKYWLSKGAHISKRVLSIMNQIKK